MAWYDDEDFRPIDWRPTFERVARDPARLLPVGTEAKPKRRSPNIQFGKRGQRLPYELCAQRLAARLKTNS